MMNLNWEPPPSRARANGTECHWTEPAASEPLLWQFNGTASALDSARSSFAAAGSRPAGGYSDSESGRGPGLGLGVSATVTDL